MFTDTGAKKQGPAVYLTLTGHACNAVYELSAEEIGPNNGLKKILQLIN